MIEVKGMWFYLMMMTIAVCVTIDRVLARRLEFKGKQQVIGFHCPDCKKFYPLVDGNLIDPERDPMW
jgi:hypothetical protein